MPGCRGPGHSSLTQCFYVCRKGTSPEVANGYSESKRALRPERRCKKGPRAWKTAALLTIGDRSTGEIKGHRFIVQTWERGTTGSSYQFERKADYRWSCENDEIKLVQALVNENLPTDGNHLMV